jgi:hypothetical protein
MFNRLAVLFALLALFSAPRIFAGPAWQAARAAPADEEPQVFMGGGLNAGLEPPEDSGYAESRGVEEKTAWGAP